MSRRLGQLDRIPVTELRGVGPQKAASLAALGITTVLDLVTTYPRRWIDRSRECRIEDLDDGVEALVLCRVVRVASRRTKTRKTVVSVDVTDGTGRLRLSFFNQPWRERQLAPDTNVALFGKVERYGSARQMTNPLVDLVGDRTGRIVPIYPQSEKANVHSWDLARWVAEALRRAGDFADPVPAELAARWDLVDRTVAFHDIHAPETLRARDRARDRLVFDELLRVQLALALRKRHVEQTVRGIAHEAPGELVRRFTERLPFSRTAAQVRVIDEITADLRGPHPMHRLLQGDVGAGKTVVAVAAMLLAVEGGHQAALMAPTEVLAEQHFAGIAELVKGFRVGHGGDGTLFAGPTHDRELRLALLTNRVGAAARARTLAALDAGEIDVVIGTHALIAEAVAFHSLGVVVIDEQHRFGVDQRAALRAKAGGGAVPDVLVMTATPIPRTAAMTVYGDLDVSVLDEKPAGRHEVMTMWARDDDAVAEAWQLVRDEVAAGRQAYVVCPLVEESDKLQVAAAEATHAELTAAGGELADLRVGLLHGRVRTKEKDTVMSAFRSGELDVLVATTVIEVGVDVPNATVMVVLDADRFGIAQLHQLRGRVGRGGAASRCVLVADPATPDGEARLAALVRTSDGFELAEVDLDLRGEGAIMGERQKGRSDLKLASLRRDRVWVERAREAAFALVDAPDGLDRSGDLVDEVRLFLGDDEADYLLKS